MKKKLRRTQRALARKRIGSRKRSSARLRVAKVYEKITNQREDFLNKLVLKYVRNYQTIYIEKLNIGGMLKNKRLSKAISDVAWGIFFEKLRVKAESAGREIIKVNPRYTSQDCSKCGVRIPKKFYTRIYQCPHCGLTLDRDENAALNILTRGRAVHSDVKLRLT